MLVLLFLALHCFFVNALCFFLFLLPLRGLFFLAFLLYFASSCPFLAYRFPIVMCFLSMVFVAFSLVLLLCLIFWLCMRFPLFVFCSAPLFVVF